MRLKHAKSLQEYLKQLEHDLDILKKYANEFYEECDYSGNFPRHQGDTYNNHLNIIQQHQRMCRDIKKVKDISKNTKK